MAGLERPRIAVGVGEPALYDVGSNLIHPKSISQCKGKIVCDRNRD